MQDAMKYLLVLVAVFVSGAAAFGEVAELTAARFQYDSAVTAIRAARMEGERSLAAQYTNVLGALRAKAQNDGDLDRLKLVMAEASRFASERCAPADAPATADLQNLAASFTKRSHELNLKEASDIVAQAVKYDAVLADLQKRLTKQGSVDAASAVQDARKSLASTGEAAEAKALLSGPQDAVAKSPVRAAPSIVEMLTSPDYEWSVPENLGKSVNGPGSEFCPAVTDDGLILVFASLRNGQPVKLYECCRKSTEEPFGEAVAIEQPGPSASNPFLSADGLTLLYESEQGPGHQGVVDLYLLRRRGRTAPWEKPGSIGETVNTSASEGGPCLSRDGLTLLFHGTRPGTRGGSDLWRSTRKSVLASWEMPENLGEDFCTAVPEFFPRFAADNRTILFARWGRPHQMFVAAPTANGRNVARLLELPVNGNVNSAAWSADGRILYFTSDCAGGHGGNDLWATRRTSKRK